MRIVVAMAVACLSIVSLSHADAVKASARTSVTIPAQGLGPALQTLSRERDMHVVFISEDVGKRRTQGASGSFTFDEALSRILIGTGLTYQYIDDQTVSILPVTPLPAPSAAGTDATVAPAREKEAAARQRSRFWRLAQTDAGPQGPQLDQGARAAATEPRAGAKTEALYEITVTASRVARPGSTAPTPTTVIGEVDLRQSGATALGTVVNDFPVFRATVSAATTTTTTGSGRTQAELRGLGAARTLVLIDGHRPVPTSNGGFDLNLVPFSLVKRVEVVTGGASAAWGSDAVAGVVNVILDNEFEGIKAETQYGATTYGDGDEYQLDLAFGSNFAGDKGHFMIGGEYVNGEGIRPRTARDYAADWALLANPTYTPTNGQPQFLIAPDVHYSVASLGGLILTGPLAGQQFGENGVLTPFTYGINRGPTFMQGGDGLSLSEYAPLLAPVKRSNVLARVSYDFTDATRLVTDLIYARSSSSSDFYPEVNLGNLVVRSGNPYLPAAVQSQMTAMGIPQLVLGRVNADFGSIHNYVEYEQMQGTVGIEGRLGESWRWNAYYSYGHTNHDNTISNLRISSLFANAVDVVRDPATGAPVCRSTLTNPTNGCVPLNVIGPNAATPAALAYFEGAASLFTDLTQQVRAASMTGEPLSTWAGPVSVAFGGEWRRQTIDAVPDDISRVNGFTLINHTALKGEGSVQEGFAEAVVPLLVDAPLVKSFELNGAVRYSDYSPGSRITSWKTGATHHVTGSLWLRATRSADMRAPALTELYLQRRINFASVIDRATGVQVPINVITSGNTNLEPEDADTTTFGVIYQPEWAAGLYASVDYYDIGISDAITTIPAQSMVDRCAGGVTELCSFITRNAAGTITDVATPYINLSEVKARGLDFELGYSRGPVDLRLVGTHVMKAERYDGIVRTNDLGNVGSISVGVPRWRFVASGTYSFNSGTVVDLRSRFLGGGAYDANFRIDDNTVGDRVYVDLSLEQRLPGSFGSTTLFANVRNLLNTEPPKLPNQAYFDVIGRMFHVGARVEF